MAKSSSLRLSTLRGMKAEDDVKTVLKIDLDDIIRDPSQPRKKFDPASLQEMAENLAEFGQMQPVLVRENLTGEGPPFMIFDGERRWRAAKLHGVPAQLEAIVYAGDVDPDKILEGQFLVNEHSEQMSFEDRAAFYKGRVERYGSVEKVAERLKLSPKRIYKVLQAGNLDGTAGQARDMGLSKDPETLNGIGALEKKDPQAARELVGQAAQSGKKLTRKDVTDANRAARTKKEGKAGGDPVAKLPAAAPASGASPGDTATGSQNDKPPAQVAEHPLKASDAVSIPRIYVSWDGGDAGHAKLWKQLVKKGPARLDLTSTAEGEGQAAVLFGTEKKPNFFPLAGLRIDRIEVAQ